MTKSKKCMTATIHPQIDTNILVHTPLDQSGNNSALLAHGHISQNYREWALDIREHMIIRLFQERYRAIINQKTGIKRKECELLTIPPTSEFHSIMKRITGRIGWYEVPHHLSLRLFFSIYENLTKHHDAHQKNREWMPDQLRNLILVLFGTVELTTYPEGQAPKSIILKPWEFASMDIITEHSARIIDSTISHEGDSTLGIIATMLLDDTKRMQ